MKMTDLPSKADSVNEADQDDYKSMSSEDEESDLEYPYSKVSALTKKKKRILKHLKVKNAGNYAKVMSYLSEYDILRSEFKIICLVQSEKKKVTQEVKDKFIDWSNDHINSNNKFHKKVSDWLSNADQYMKGTVNERDFIEFSDNTVDSIDVEVQASEMKSVSEARLKLNTKSTEVSNKMNVGNIASESSGMAQQGLPLHNQNMNENPGISNVDLAQILLQQNQITKLLVENQARQRLPQAEPEIFNGVSAVDYKSFILSFDRTVGTRTTDPADLYYNLIKYTDGVPKAEVKAFDSDDINHAYQRARNMLEKKYGNQYVLADYYLNKLEKWKPITQENLKSLQELSIFLNQCLSRMNNMTTLNQLNSPKEIRDILKKLPYEYQKKFREIATTKMEKNKPILFEDLVKFVDRQVKVLETPIFGELKFEDKNTGKKAFHTQKSTNNGKERNPCICCKRRNHELNSCFFFLKKSLEERQNFVKEKRICFGCLKTTEHNSKNCKNRLVCDQCKGKHPTSLHMTKNPTNDTRNEVATNSAAPPPSNPNEVRASPPQASGETQAAATDSSSQPTQRSGSVHQAKSNNSENIKHPAVLVDVKFRGSNKVVRTYLGLDTYCNSTYIDEELVREAGASSVPVSFSLTTVQSTNKLNHFGKVADFEILSLDRSVKTAIDEAFIPSNWPFSVEDSPHQSDTSAFEKLEKLPISYENKKIGILIGMQRSDVLLPLQVISTTKKGPYATRHIFGWAINGTVGGIPRSGAKVFHTFAQLDNTIEESFNAVFARDFIEVDEKQQPSIEDQRWLNIVENSIEQLPNNHLQMKLPFKTSDVEMPDNFEQAYSRLMKMKTKFQKDPQMFEEYKSFMQDMLDNNYAEVIPADEVNRPPPGKRWYLIHFAVTHKTKKKLRIVYDCSLRYNNVSLNDMLLQGPDCTNSLVGVLLRFRQDSVAFSSDVKSMFYQLRVPVEDSEFLRFVWFPNHDINQTPMHYRLRVHVFGAKSSPSCASYALRSAVTFSKNKYSEEVVKTVQKNAYVDDILKSVSSDSKAVKVATDLINLLEEVKFNLTSFISNSRVLLSSLPVEKLSKDLKQLDLSTCNLPDEKTLGMVWNPEKDVFGCRLNLEEHPCTKRGVLKTLFSIYDPLFLISPSIILAKRIFQESCALKIDWDENLPPELTRRWQQWTKDLPLLCSYEIPRCYSISNFVVEAQLHFFSDGSNISYGCVAFLRTRMQDGSIYTNIVSACARMTPINRTSLRTTPRIELNSCKLSVCLLKRIVDELDIRIDKRFFWTDSITCLKYIKSEEGRFQTFVANRVAFIRANTSPDQWNHVKGKINPADILSRGSNIPNFMKNENWKIGPPFLRTPEEEWNLEEVSLKIPENDEELKKKKLCFATKSSSGTEILLNHSSSWTKTKFLVAVILKFLRFRMNKSMASKRIEVRDLREAEVAIWRYVQKKELLDVHEALKQKRQLKKHRFAKLNPFLDKNDLIRAEGRLKKSTLSQYSKHPIMLPKSNHLVKSLCRYLHSLSGHLGRENLIVSIRKQFYIVGVSSLAYRITKECQICRVIMARPSEQRMADLPSDRLTPDLPPFSSTGVDAFGPFYVTKGRGRAKEKRYGLIMSCMASRAMHLEVLHSLDTSSFINALRRFTSRRGPVQKIRSDNGTNFVSGQKELAQGVKNWNSHLIGQWCRAKEIEWIFNVPLAPHWGGAWEREIRTVKKTLTSITSELENRRSIDDETLVTLFCEVESILNGRPLTSVTCDLDDEEPLTPNHLLRPHADRSFPPGIFSPTDLYSKRRWRQVQFLADEFWRKWRNQYLPLLLARQKWNSEARSHEVGDLVLVVDQLLPRNLWCLGRISEVRRDREGRVRSAEVVVSKSKDGRNLRIGTNRLERPISKLILLKTLEEL